MHYIHSEMVLALDGRHGSIMPHPVGRVKGLSQLSRHDDEASDVDRSHLVYAATIIPINWANWFRWMRRRSVRERRWL
jgi:hypothetical protein